METSQSQTSAAPAIQDQAGTHGSALALQRMRTRLLDLTIRNSLLNYRHTPSSCVRVIDEIPDALFQLLGRDSKPVLVPVPSAARTGPAPQARRGGGSSVPVLDQAKAKGLDVSLDLPAVGGKTSHEDNKIQCALYPEDLERVLRKLKGAARLAIEEKGVNVLYLAFGFLEWYESDDSTSPHLAPLMLLPVALEKGKLDAATGLFRYSLEVTGEDITANLSLRELLRRDLGLALPDIEEDDTPESYAAKLSHIVSANPRWRIRRFVTLGLFQFGKLLMYLDLDPDRWPAGSPLLAHPVAGVLLGASAPRLEDGPVAEHDLDAMVGKELDRFPIVFDADSSQHSALIDALNGHNLVIQGPPGTGKSQTICNLIAAGLYQGKKILFVAEKMAALEVVKRRLDSAGLGQFCLDLHSTKGQRHAVLDQLRARRRFHKAPASDSAHADCQRQWRDHWQQLKQHCELMHRPYGQTGLAYHQVFAAAVRYRNQVPADVAGPHDVRLGMPEYFSPELRAGKEATLLAFADALRGAAETPAKLGEHPWRWVKSVALSPYQAEEVLAATRAWQSALLETVGAIARANQRFALDLPPTADTVGLFVRVGDLCHRVAKSGVAPVLSRSKQGAMRASLCGFRDRVQQRALLWSGLVTRFLTADLDDASAHERAAQVLADLSRVGMGSDTTLHSAARLHQETAERFAAAQRFRSVVVGLSRALPWAVDTDSLTDLQLAARVISACRQAPWGALHLRTPSIVLPAFAEVAEGARTRQRDILALRGELDGLLDVDARIDAAAAREAISELRQGGLLACLRPRWRSASRLARSLRVEGNTLRGPRLTTAFGNFAKMKTLEAEFVEDSALKAALGGGFHGLSTDFDSLIQLRMWYETLGPILGSTSGPKPDLVAAIWGLDEVRTREICTKTAELDLATAESAMCELGATFGSLDTGFSGLVEHFLSILGSAVDKGRGLGIPPALSVAELERQVQRWRTCLDLRDTLQRDVAVSECLGIHFRGAATDLTFLETVLSAFRDLEELDGPDSLRACFYVLPGPAAEEELRNACMAVQTASDLARSSSALVAALAEADINALHGPTIPDTVGELGRALAAAASLAPWIDYMQCRLRCEQQGLGHLADLGERGVITRDSCAAACRAVLFQAMARDILARKEPLLAAFSGNAHSHLRERFGDLDEQFLDLTARHIAHTVDRAAKPAPGNHSGPVSTYTDMALLEHEENKKRGHIPIRQLIRRAGPAISELMPCLMMSPLSVSHYLPPGAFEFDLLIMDEASQLKPEDSIGAVARAKQIVVVGDSNQLPPTSFFDLVVDDEADADDRFGLEETESILDAVAGMYPHRRCLRWHYRSRHERLIAFSNHHFYDDELVVFPSPDQGNPRLGLRWHYVKDAVYGAGKNEREALAVARAVVEHMRNCRGESLGVAAMNIQQLHLIEDAIDRELKANPDVCAAMEEAEARAEPFFVKNLENVQGDERDVIFISMTYGPGVAGGRVSPNFGPINKAGGWRRLNVLFTRAKLRVEVFSSMRAQDVVPADDSNRGVQALKDYLLYAETGVIESGHTTEREAGSDFEIGVAQELGRLGYETVPQVGVAGFYIDLGVLNPDRPGEFLLGIECDGASYHSGKSVRDRDRLRQLVLERLGWRIHRIWSTDWFNAPASEISKVERTLAAVRAQHETTVDAPTPGADRAADAAGHLPDPLLRSAPPASADDGHPAAVPTPAALSSKPVQVRTGGSGGGSPALDAARLSLDELYNRHARFIWPDLPREAWFLSNAEIAAAILEAKPTDRREYEERVPASLRKQIPDKYFTTVASEVYRIFRALQAQQAGRRAVTPSRGAGAIRTRGGQSETGAPGTSRKP